MDDKQSVFLIEEYKILKEELLSLVKEARLLETAAIAGTAGIYAWLVKTPNTDSIEKIGWWIPVLFPLFGAFRQIALLTRIMHIAEYIRALEKEICKVSPFGWETFLAEKRTSTSGNAISITAIIFWVCLLYTSPSPRDRG